MTIKSFGVGMILIGLAILIDVWKSRLASGPANEQLGPTNGSRKMAAPFPANWLQLR